MTETIQGALFYTQDEMNEATLNAETRAVKITASTISTNIVDVLKSEVREGNLVKEYANSLYSRFVSEANLDPATIETTFSVTAYYNGSELCTFTGVEADDEDSACEEVSENISIDDIEVNFSLDYNGDTNYCSASLSSYDLDLSSDLTFEAEAE